MKNLKIKIVFLHVLLIIFSIQVIPQDDNDQDEPEIIYNSEKSALEYDKSVSKYESLSTNTTSTYLARIVNLRVINKNLVEVIKYLAKAGDVSIVYDDQLLDIPGITADLKEVTLYKALDEILTPFNISFYEYTNGKIALAKSKKINETTGGLQGIVKDTSGDRLIGANIKIKELQIGSQSDSKGYYSIKNIKAGDYIVVASFMGYRDFARRIHIKNGSMQELNITLVPTTLMIGGIEVVGSSELLPKDVNTKTLITSGEIEHYQASSIKDVLDLVPGVQKSDNPGLSKTTQISVRGDDQDMLSSFGTLIVVDGTPVTNNANLQFQAPIDAIVGSNNMGGGVDLRTIPADNIESIEVITGLPSVRYGDFTEGIINVKTKLGSMPDRIKIKNNPQVSETNFGGGRLLGESGINYNFNLARDARDIRVAGDEYWRLTGQSTISNNFYDNQLNNDIKFNFQVLYDEEQPQGDVLKTINYNRGYSLGLSTRGKYQPTDGVSAFEYNFYINMNRKNSMRSKIIQSQPRIVNGDTISSYLGKVESRGLEWNLGGRIEWSRIFYTGDLIHKFIAGSEPQFNANTGKGEILDSLFNYFGSQSTRRSFNYNSIPGQMLFNLYAEDKISGHLLFDYSMSIGFRYEMYRPYAFNLSGLWGKGDFVKSHQGTYFNPRLSMMVYLSSYNQIRFSAGTTSKSPPMSSIFPEEQEFTWRNPLDSTNLYFNYNTRVPELKGTKEVQYELSFDQKISNILGFTVSGYYKYRANEPQSVENPVFFASEINGKTNVYYIDSYTIDKNLGNTASKGLELSLTTAKIKPLNMELKVAASYSFIKKNTNSVQYDPTPTAALGRYPNYTVPGTSNDTLVGYMYTDAMGGDWKDMLQLNYYLTYTHPSLGLWITLSIEHLARYKFQENNLEPEDLSILNDAQRLVYDFNRRISSAPPKFLCNLNVSKSLWAGAEVSFYVNNFLDDPAIWRQLTSPPSTYSDFSRNPSLFYGLEFSMNLDNVYRRN